MRIGMKRAFGLICIIFLLITTFGNKLFYTVQATSPLHFADGCCHWNMYLSINLAKDSAFLVSMYDIKNQEFPQELISLTYGQSITDKCIDWETTEKLIFEAAEKL